MATDNLKCTCGAELTADNTYTYAGISKCKKCFFEAGDHGPMTSQYKNCPKCSTEVHTFTIKCPKCGSQIHETGTITVRRTIKGSFVLAYGLLMLVLLVTALVIPGHSGKGFVAWPMTIGGLAISAHGFMGPIFFMLPFGFKTLHSLGAIGVGILEAAIGLFLIFLPML